MNYLELANPWYLLLLLLIPLIIVERKIFRRKAQNTLSMPSLKNFSTSNQWHYWVPPLLFTIRMIALSSLVLALARPRKVDISSYVKSNEGVDIMMVVDVSLSMMARDLKPTRLEALKNVAKEFISQRSSDRIGIVAYSGNAITKAPLTTDKTILKNTIKNLDMEGLEAGTAIGVGLATGINHLQHSKAKSKVVLLITDGGESPVDLTEESNIYISPQEAAEIAAEKGIKVYTIGIGTTGYVLPPEGKEYYPQNLFKLDEDLLQFIAQKANGRYFRATDNDKLKSIYAEINALEKSKIEEMKYYNYEEYYRTFVLWAFVCILAEVIFRTLVFKQLA